MRNRHSLKNHKFIQHTKQDNKKITIQVQAVKTEIYANFIFPVSSVLKLTMLYAFAYISIHTRKKKSNSVKREISLLKNWLKCVSFSSFDKNERSGRNETVKPSRFLGDLKW